MSLNQPIPSKAHKLAHKGCDSAVNRGVEGSSQYVSGKVEITASTVVVTLDKRAHNPYLVASGLTDRPVPMPWFGNKQLILQFA